MNGSGKMGRQKGAISRRSRRGVVKEKGEWKARREKREKRGERGEVQYVACVTRFSGFLLPGLTNDDLRGEWYFGGFLTDLKVLSAALMKNGL